MTGSLPYLILGNGIAGITAAETLRAEHPEADITLLTDEPYRAYYRPALKDYLAGHVQEALLWARPASSYQDLRLHVVMGHVTTIVPEQHLVVLHTGQRIPYSRLLLATGAPATHLTCPGAHLSGVLPLHTLADYQELLHRLPSVKRILICGGGTLALETAEILHTRGHAVTHLIRRRTLWSEVLDTTTSDLVLQQERRSGVEVHVEEEIAEVIGKDGQVTGVVTRTGKHFSCDVLIAAIGITPRLDFLQQCGIACGLGVRVNAHMQTSVPDIYAAGDVIETSFPMQQRMRLLGLWYPAIQQARAAAYSMLDLFDLQHPFRFDICYNATTLYGYDCTTIGLTYPPGNEYGYLELVAPTQPRSYRKVVLRHGVVVGLLALGDRTETLAVKRAIDAQVNLLPIASVLFQQGFSLSAWLDQQGVPPAHLSVGKADAKTMRVQAVRS